MSQVKQLFKIKKKTVAATESQLFLYDYKYIS